MSPLYFSNADIKPSRYVPLWWAIVPPKSPDTIDWLYRLGWEDACRWIKAHPERCDLPHLSTKILSPISPPPKRPHPYDTPKRVSVHRLLGYNISDQMHRTVARSLDIFLNLLVILIWKPLVLILIYTELLLSSAKSILVTAALEVYSLSPMVALQVALLGPHHVLIALFTTALYGYKLVLVGPHPYSQLNDLYECVSCIWSLSLLCRTLIPSPPSTVQLRKHHKLIKRSLTYRIVMHTL